jgi:hypothetical protein
VRGLLARLALAAGGLVLALVLVELLLPLALDRGPCSGQAPFWRPDAAAGWSLVPDVVREASVCDADGKVLARHSVAVNALGLRDRPRTFARVPGRKRVLVLGDSYVEAMQVDLEDTFLARLERTTGAEMIDAGVSGYSTDNELRAFDARDHRFAPDVVLLVFFVGNDVLENGARLYLKNPHGLPPKPWVGLGEPTEPLARCFAAARAAAHVADATPGFMWRTSRGVRWTLTGGVGAALQKACGDAAGPSLVPGRPELFGVYGPPETVAWEQAWTATEANLAALVTRVRDSGAAVGVVLAPWHVEYDPRSVLHLLFARSGGRAWEFGYPYERLGAVVTKLGVPWMSLAPTFAAHYAATGRTGAYEWDGHWNAEGHTLVATALEPFILRLMYEPSLNSGSPSEGKGQSPIAAAQNPSDPCSWSRALSLGRPHGLRCTRPERRASDEIVPERHVGGRRARGRPRDRVGETMRRRRRSGARARRRCRAMRLRHLREPRAVREMRRRGREDARVEQPAAHRVQG